MAENDSRTKQLRGKLEAARARVAEQDRALAALRRELRVSRSLLAEKDAAVRAVHGSFSWRITAPIRLARKLVLAALRRPLPTSAAEPPVAASEMVAAAPKTCIFAHHDRKAALSDYVIELVRGIASSGYAILFVSTAKEMPATERKRLETHCAAICFRENLGRDFGSWQFGLRRLKALENLEWLVLANDSVFGPLFDLGEVARKMETSGADFWGITESYQEQWHLQSYFLGLSGAVVRSEVFGRFFARDFARLTKRQIIEQGEVGLSQQLLAAGFEGVAYCPYEVLDRGRRDFSRNPMHQYWDTLITEARCPFLKIELVRDNPFDLPGVERYGEVVSALSDYDLDLISAHLKRAGAAKTR